MMERFGWFLVCCIIFFIPAKVLFVLLAGLTYILFGGYYG